MRAILLTVLAALSTLSGGWLALRARKHIHLLLGFGAGVLLGATFFDLLPEAIEAAGPRGLCHNVHITKLRIASIRRIVLLCWRTIEGLIPLKLQL